MARFARVQTDNREVNQLQLNIAQLLEPMAANPLTQGNILTQVALTSGTNTIAHKLGRKLIGWQVIRQRASATLYDLQDANLTPAQTLVLVASANVTVDLYVF